MRLRIEAIVLGACLTWMSTGACDTGNAPDQFSGPRTGSGGSGPPPSASVPTGGSVGTPVVAPGGAGVGGNHADQSAATAPPPQPPPSPPAPTAMDAAVVVRDAAMAVPQPPPRDAAAVHDASTARDAGPPASATSAHVFIIAMENEGFGAVYGNPNAPYINGVLVPSYASATNFADELPAAPSEPHYVWLEAGTNSFADHTFTTDDPPSAVNSTGSTEHLVTQIENGGRGLGWTAYQEGAAAGVCPVASTGLYVPRHNPFVFFRDVAGAPPSGSQSLCAAHHRPLSALDGDLASDTVPSYVFITPNLCHDMHGSFACPPGNLVRAGDDWLSGALPPIVSYVGAHGGVIFVTWDQGNGGGSGLPFLAIGPHVKKGYQSSVAFNHSAVLRSVERILQLPALSTVAGATDLSDLFVGGTMP